MIDVINLKKSFGSVEVLKGINMTINKGDIVAIIGPSGSGVNIDIDLHICNIHPVENDLSRCRVFHTVQAAEKCTLTGT